MRKMIQVASAATLLMAGVPGAAFAAGTYTIPAAPAVSGTGSGVGIDGPGTIGPNGGGVQSSPGVGLGRTFSGLSSTTGATGAADGGVGGTSGGLTGTNGGVAGVPGGLAGAGGTGLGRVGR